MAYSVDFRKKVIAYIEAGHTQLQACDKFNICWGTVNKWWQRYKKTGKLEDAPWTKREPRKAEKFNFVEYKKFIDVNPHATRAQTADALGISKSTLYRALVWEEYEKKRGTLERSKLKLYIDANPTATNREIGKAFGCKEWVVSQTRKKYGFSAERRLINRDELRKYLETYPNATVREIGDALGFHSESIRRALKKLKQDT